MLRSISFLSAWAPLALLLPLAGACTLDGRDVGNMEEDTDPLAPAASSMGGSGSSAAGSGGSTTAGSDGSTAVGTASSTAGNGGAPASGADADAPPTNEPSNVAGNTSGTEGNGPAPVELRSAGNYAILAQSAITNVPTSAITGDVGISPAAASSITGLVLTLGGIKLTAPEVVGDIFAADGQAPTPIALIAAVSDMQAAYADAAGRVSPDFLELGDGSIGGLTLRSGLYKWTSVVTIPTDVTISGSANDVWIFQISGDLTLSSGRRIILAGGARPENIIWQVAGAVDLDTQSHAEGIVLSKTAIHLKTGSSINGRLLAQTAVTLDQAMVSETD
jgi:hypothetical protein